MTTNEPTAQNRSDDHRQPPDEQAAITIQPDNENPFEALASDLHDNHGWTHRDIETAMYDAEIGVSTAILSDIQGGHRG